MGFAISARMSEALHAAILAVPEEAWRLEKSEAEAERQWAEVPFVPGEKTEKKNLQPLRYVAVRVRKRQGELFGDGSAVKHFAVVSNIQEWSAAKLLQWHREKAARSRGCMTSSRTIWGGGDAVCSLRKQRRLAALGGLDAQCAGGAEAAGVAAGTAARPAEAITVSDLPYAGTNRPSCATRAVAVGGHQERIEGWIEAMEWLPVPVG